MVNFNNTNGENQKTKILFLYPLSQTLQIIRHGNLGTKKRSVIIEMTERKNILKSET